MIQYTFLIIILFGHFLGDQPNMNDIGNTKYRCVRYKLPVNFERISPIAPGVPPILFTDKYFIQYGENRVIEITDPGYEVDYLPVTKVVWDYTAGIFTSDFYLRHVRKFYSNIDSIGFPIDMHRGEILTLCTPNPNTRLCDSLRYTSLTTNKQYILYFSDSIPNIKSFDLFYPDIQWLPYKIIPQHTHLSPWFQDTIIFGQHSVDSILAIFNYAGFDRITEREIRDAMNMYPIENIKNQIPSDKH